LPTTWPKKLRVVAWNMEYTDELDAQVDALLTHPELKDADVYLLSEVDRCSTRNDVRRAARYMAQKLQAEYVYGIEFVELSIGRTIGGDTGQAIVSRRPLTGAALTCHTQEFPWATDKGEPRIGQRVVLHADIPAGSTSIRVHSVHLESRDALGEKRAAQIKQVLDRAQALGCERPQIVAGDFNAWYPTAPELTLMKQTGFADALAAAGDTGETDTRGTRLDYMWVRGLTVSAGGVLRDVKLSDHFPLWADLTVP
jgi:endonuclease/exonuclease/phosphatase family metal-dependent hydrolase